MSCGFEVENLILISGNASPTNLRSFAKSIDVFFCS